jgi:hypothetical protein
MAISAVVQIIGAVAAVAGAVTSYASAQAQAQAADYNRKVAENQAEAARQGALVAEDNQRTQDRRILAATRARAAASGISEDEGSSLLDQEQSALTSKLNEARIRWSGENQRQGYQSEAVLQGFYGASAARGGYLAAGTNLLTAAAKGYGAYAAYSGGSGDAITTPGYQAYRTGERQTY